MTSRNIFKKKKSNKKIIIFFLSSLFFLFFFIYFFILKNDKKFIVIPENTENFYIIPKDRGGEKVLNLDKKSLNLKTQEIGQNNIEKAEDLLFSIQFYTDNDLEKVNKFLNKITNFDESIYNLNDFYILAFSSEIGIEYFLLYKSFTNRLDAKNYCLNFLHKIENCFIVDTSKF